MTLFIPIGGQETQKQFLHECLRDHAREYPYWVMVRTGFLGFRTAIEAEQHVNREDIIKIA